MIHDAYCGKFKMIVTKEVSRFSRNLLDTIAYTRDLKQLGIGVVFLNDGFCSLDADSELRLSIMGSIAQEESRRTSSRVKWGQTRQMERGIVFGTSLLGYYLHKGKLSINPEEAEIVRFIFRKYGIEKKGTSIIAKELRDAGYQTHRGNPVWSSSHILKILHNEKYVGDLVQKKTITPDYLSHAKKSNKGQEELITQHNHHEPIIDRILWDTVQSEIASRNRKNTQHSGCSNRYLFSGKIICGECGSRFVARWKNRKNGTTYLRWCCYKATTQGAKKTDVPPVVIGCDIGKVIRDDLLVQSLTEVFKSMPLNFQWIIQNLTNIANRVIHTDLHETNTEQKLEAQIQKIIEKKTTAIDAFLSGMISKDELNHIKEMYENKLSSLNNRLETFRAAAQNTTPPSISKIRDRISEIISCDRIVSPLYRLLTEKIIVQKDGTFQIYMRHLPLVWYFELKYNKDGGYHSNPSVPISVSRPFNSSNGIL